MMFGKKGQIGAIIIIVIFCGVVIGGIYWAEVTGLPYAEGIRKTLANMLGVPEDLLKFPSAIYFLILPYLTTTIIIFGIFMELGIFRRVYGGKREIIYMVIAATWAMFLLPTGILGFVATWLYTVGALLSIAIFMILFVLGSVVWAKASYRGVKGRIGVLGDLYNERRDLMDRLRELAERYGAGRISEERYRERRGRLEQRLRWVNKRILTLEEAAPPPEKKPKEK